ncbi:hypothetical protein BH11VER1_BH11VER1_37110 [soil metagenome]
MRIKYKFYIEKGIRPTTEICAWAYVNDTAAYEKLCGIARAYWDWRNDPGYPTIIVNTFEDDPHLAEALTILKQCGWTPYFEEFVPELLQSTCYEIRRYRFYEKQDFESCEYFSIEQWGIGNTVFSFNGIRDGIYCGKTKGAKWKTRYGLTYDCGASPFFVNGQFKQELESMNLIGLTFQPVLFDEPSKARGEFWQMQSSVVMPPCLLPVIAIPDKPLPLIAYDDHGHQPRELVFERAAVGQMEPFDIAITREDVVCRPNSWCRNFVVSQRFRKAIGKLKLSTVKFVPARLRD